MAKNKEKIMLEITNETIVLYEEYYFKNHPRASKKPIDNPYHPSINAWMIMKRPMMNALKQKWKGEYIFGQNEV